MHPADSQKVKVREARWQPHTARSEQVTEAFALWEKLCWELYCLVPGLRDDEMGPGGPVSGFLLLPLLDISPGWFWALQEHQPPTL